MSKRFNNILETIGRTPVVKVAKFSPPGVEVFVKLEAFNPLGSVKDRLALGVIEAAERSGALKPGQTVIEATSGNTGIGLAMVCAQKGYPLVVTMAENFSVERRKLMRFLGAKVVLDSGIREGQRNGRQGGWNSPRRMAGSFAVSSRTKPTRTFIPRPRRLKFWTTSRETGSTIGSPAWAPAARSRVLRGS